MGELSDKGKGTFKDDVGKASGNRKMEAEGKVDKGKGKVKEVVRRATNNVKDRERGL